MHIFFIYFEKIIGLNDQFYDLGKTFQKNFQCYFVIKLYHFRQFMFIWTQKFHSSGKEDNCLSLYQHRKNPGNIAVLVTHQPSLNLRIDKCMTQTELKKGQS